MLLELLWIEVFKTFKTRHLRISSCEKSEQFSTFNYFDKKLFLTCLTKFWIRLFYELLRNSHQRCSIKIGVLKNYANFTRKHLYRSLFFSGLRPAVLIKKRPRHKCFPVNFAKFLRMPFFIEHMTASDYWNRETILHC